MEFEKVKDKVGLLEVNTTAAYTYAGEIERHIHCVSEWSRWTSSIFPCTNVPTQVVIHLIYNVCLWLNDFPLNSGISIQFSPQKVWLSAKLTMKDCKSNFSAYVEASTNVIVTNTNTIHTHGCIALGPSSNWQGSLKCFDIETIKVITRRIVQQVPIPDWVIKR